MSRKRHKPEQLNKDIAVFHVTEKTVNGPAVFGSLNPTPGDAFRIEPKKESTPLPVLSHAGPCRNPECTMCPEWRKKLGRENQTMIYAQKGAVRYCKCRVCGHTWKIISAG